MAYMAAFYNGRSTQESLRDYIKLSNITSPVQLSASFDGLVVVGKNNSLKYKNWFCNSCIKPISGLSQRLERACPTCETK